MVLAMRPRKRSSQREGQDSAVVKDIISHRFIDHSSWTAKGQRMLISSKYFLGSTLPGEHDRRDVDFMFCWSVSYNFFLKRRYTFYDLEYPFWLMLAKSGLFPLYHPSLYIFYYTILLFTKDFKDLTSR